MRTKNKLNTYRYSFDGRRESNQDRAFIIESGNLTFMAVADGMGGHSGGEIASEIIETTAREVLSEIQESTNHDLKNILSSVYAKSDLAIKNKSKSDAALDGMGSTLSAVLLDSDFNYAYASIGDSRIYLLSGEESIQLTKDHSFIQQYLDNFGPPVPQDVLRKGNILTKALDGKGDQPDIYPVDSDFQTLLDGEVLFICSDGLFTDYRKNYGALINDYVTGCRSIKQATRQLISHAFNSGSKDNISIAIASLGSIGKRNNAVQTFRFPPSENKPELVMSGDEIREKSESKRKIVSQVLFVIPALAIILSLFFLVREPLSSWLDTRSSYDNQQMLQKADSFMVENDWLSAALWYHHVYKSNPEDQAVSDSLGAALARLQGTISEDVPDDSDIRVINDSFSQHFRDSQIFRYRLSLLEENWERALESLYTIYKEADNDDYIKQIFVLINDQELHLSGMKYSRKFHESFPDSTFHKKFLEYGQKVHVVNLSKLIEVMICNTNQQFFSPRTLEKIYGTEGIYSIQIAEKTDHPITANGNSGPDFTFTICDGKKELEIFFNPLTYEEVYFGAPDRFGNNSYAIDLKKAESMIADFYLPSYEEIFERLSKRPVIVAGNYSLFDHFIGLNFIHSIFVCIDDLQVYPKMTYSSENAQPSHSPCFVHQNIGDFYQSGFRKDSYGRMHYMKADDSDPAYEVHFFIEI